MNNRLLNFVLVFLIFALGLGSLFYYRASRPKYTPPPPREEINITIIPGWNLRQIAADWVKKGVIKNESELYVLVGEPAKNYRAVKKDAPVLSWTATGTMAELFSDKRASVSYE